MKNIASKSNLALAEQDTMEWFFLILKIKFMSFTFILCNFLVRTIQTFQTTIKTLKKLPSKVANNRLGRAVFSTINLSKSVQVSNSAPYKIKNVSPHDLYNDFACNVDEAHPLFILQKIARNTYVFLSLIPGQHYKIRPTKFIDFLQYQDLSQEKK